MNIVISGQQSSNHTLADAITMPDENKIQHIVSNGCKFIIEYPSKSQARKAIQAAYDCLKQTELGENDLLMSHDREKLVYKQSIACIKP